MTGSWVFCILLYALIKGLREGIKKKAMSKSSITEVLFFYTLTAFLFQIPFAHHIFALQPLDYVLIFLKSFIIFIAWICAFHAIRQMPVSLYSVLDLTRMLFSVALGVLILQETMGWRQWVGLAIVLAGLLLVNLRREKSDMPVRHIYVLLTLISCFLNAVSGILDKVYLRTMETSQMQFWYMLFLTLLYLVYLLLTKTKVNWGTLKTNFWIPLLGFIFIIGDRALFIANADPNSQVTMMTLLKQSSVLFTILIGKLMFHEKQIGYRLLCACIVVAGILLAIL